MKKVNRSQISIFVVIAVIIVVAIGAFVILKQESFGTQENNPEIGPVYDFTKDCIIRTAEDAIDKLAQKSGYYNLPKEKTSNNIPFYFKDNKTIAPTKEKIESEMSLYIKKNLDSCLKDFIYFSDFSIKTSEISPIAKIKEDRIIFNVEFPMNIIKGEKTYFIKNFKDMEIETRFGLIYNLSMQLTKEQVLHPKTLCIECVSDIANKNNLEIELNNNPDNVIIYIITDDTILIKNETLMFIFAHEIQW
ncbi:hypothetical protein J4218_03230 [Candidatus Pacearchaeota archaeon]|nr:hypothetical protein [Candidatus Pacearchaeota archaeon]